jgi:hypothetical protein
MQPKSAKNDVGNEFFEHFTPLSIESNDCLSIQDLVSFARERGGDAHHEEHISSCENCGRLVNLLTTSEHGKSLHKFLAMTREEALKVAPDQPSSVFAYVRAFIANQQRWVLVPLVLLILFLVFAGPLNRKLQQRQLQYARDTSFSIGEDKYRQTLVVLMEDLEKTKSSRYDRAQLQSNIKEINQNLSELEGRMNSNQRGEMAQLVTLYNSEVQKMNAVAQTSEPKRSVSDPMPGIATTSDSQKVEELYKAIDEAIADEAKVKPAEVSEIKAAPASQQLDIVAIDDKQILVSDLSPSRSPAQQRAVHLGIKAFESKNNVRIAFQPPQSGFTSRRP